MKLILSVLLMIYAVQGLAKSEIHLLDATQRVTVNVPEGWESVENLFGMPLTLLGPWANNSRPAIMFLHTKIKSNQLSKQDLESLFNDFQKEKDEWVSKKNGTLLKYETVTPVTLKNNIEGHYIGAEFKMNHIVFIERSYYLYCKKSLYNIKYSIRDEHKKYLPVLEDIIGDFKCE